ncbi:hypothetical protein I6E09_00120 [Mediterraneibacter glycyrrhizinilyticus]|jgi:hypothetical protein|uniref:hypothetical protein n=1 Tax=Mediterraneibacter glycyrrhizinilyticus TaxID=342942 RepID=UPI000B3A3D31|nr:hypothetical protein [Mediterraneibacter glycyrrhizinilyticus]MCF2567601.1 hypothetical protein [Mediterraneibacter glycyrrhizinilyticus]MDN0044074.1 hypothetical protein [Mediterraneibacter glycyrrhizinilyticus]OUO25590.1 hypothetical protein B5F86_12490 [Lachnoclostridium sp. An298]HJA20660.1 hypothetical protein [Candidatus Mediterraneibacter ornithocaccae]
MNYYKYENQHRKCTTFRVLLILAFFSLFLRTALDASVAGNASQALQNIGTSDAAVESYTFDLAWFVLCFVITLPPLNSALFQIREQGRVLPVLIKYRFAPVDIAKMYRAKALLLLRGAVLFYIGSLIIFLAVTFTVFGHNAPIAQTMPQLGYALIFCTVFTGALLLTDWLRYKQH